MIRPELRGAIILLALCLPLAAHAGRPWERWDDCRFEARQYFDGDSFHVSHRGENQVLRLYFADAPETDTSFPDRVREQAAYFRVSQGQLLESAERARQFTARFLEKPFRVVTRREHAPGASRTPRLYARIQRDGRWLDEALIAAGLARATALPAAFPNVAAARSESLRLRAIEQTAARAGTGIWAQSQGIVHQSLSKSQRQNRSTNSAPDQTGLRRLNLNLATPVELEALPGIGPKLAAGIIRARPLRDLEALDAIRGIGPKKLAALRPLITFE